MRDRSPTSLKTPRNIALDKGTVPAGFADPELAGVLPVINAPAIHDTGATPPPATPSPFKVRGA